MVKVGGEEGGQLENQQDGDGGINSRKGDVDHHMEAVGAVDLCAFIKFRVDARHSGQINNGIISRCFDGVGDDQNRAEIRRSAEEINPFPAKGYNHIVDKAALLRGEKGRHQAGENDPRNKVGQINKGLGDAFDPAAFHLIEPQRQEDDKGKAKQNVVKINENRVPHDLPELLVIKQFFKIGPAHPGTAPKCPC